MRVNKVTDPVYAPNSKGGPQADPERYPESAVWSADGSLVRAAYSERADDDDYSQARVLINEVMDEQARHRLVNNVVGHLCDGVSQPVLERAFKYWKRIDMNVGERIEAGVKSELDM